MPGTNLGRWSGCLLRASVALFAVLLITYNPNAFGDTLAQGSAGGVVVWLVTASCVMGTLVTGVVSRVRLKGRSVAVIVATTLLALRALPQTWAPSPRASRGARPTRPGGGR